MNIDKMSEMSKIAEAKRQLAEYDRLKAHDEFEWIVLEKLKLIEDRLNYLVKKTAGLL